MSDNLEAEWKKNLTSILDDLDKDQYARLLEILDQIPKYQKEKSREMMPQIIIQCYGVDGSIMAMDDAMEQLPRRDSRVQDLLQPFVKKVKEKQKTESKRKALDPQTEEETATADEKIKLDSKTKEQRKTGGAVPVRGESTVGDQPTETPSWRKPIRDLKSSNEIGLSDTIGAKVIYKSPLQKSKTKKSFSYVLVTDETGGHKLMVHGEPHHRKIKEGKYYSFRKLVKDEAGHVKVTTDTIVAEIGSFNIPEEVEKKAQQLYSKSPFYSIKHFKTLNSKIGSVTGTVIEFNPSKSEKKEKKTEKTQSFRIEDDTDSIEVVFRGDKTQQCKNLSVDDVVVLNNVKTKQCQKIVSLQSTSATEIIQVHKVGRRNVKIEIVGITKALKTQTHLEVSLDQKIQTLTVASKLLAEAFGLTLGKDFESQLVKALPMLAEAQIEGNKIIKITCSQD